MLGSVAVIECRLDGSVGRMQITWLTHDDNVVTWSEEPPAGWTVSQAEDYMREVMATVARSVEPPFPV